MTRLFVLRHRKYVKEAPPEMLHFFITIKLTIDGKKFIKSMTMIVGISSLLNGLFATTTVVPFFSPRYLVLLVDDILKPVLATSSECKKPEKKN
jgi:hypothetical protein